MNNNKFLIVANWKLNPSTQEEVKELFNKVKSGLRDIQNVEVVICPPFVYIPILGRLSPRNLGVGAQSVFYKEKGAFTGEVSPLQLLDLGVTYVIVGHSETKKYFNETEEIINEKVKECLYEGLKPILCVGEKEGEDKEKTLQRQICEGLRGVLEKDLVNVVIAYEPVWAIGTGNNCSLEETLNSVLFIKNVIAGLYDKKTAEKVKIIYGGSVNSRNSQGYLKKAGVKGLLVGGASLKADEFVKIVTLAQ